MIKTSPSLAPSEQFRLEQCEHAIERGLNTFVEVGRALTEIRDAKLYRIGFKTFEAYCKERWEIGRSRAYELIDQAKVVAAITDAGVNLSAVADIPKRDVRAVKDDLATVSAEVKARVEQGEEPAAATAQVIKETAEKAKAEREAEKIRNQAASAEVMSKLPADVQAMNAAKAERAARKAAPADDDQDTADQIDALKQANEFLEKHVAELEAKLKTYERLELMYRDWTEGGWEQVVQAKDDTISELQRTAQSRIERESSEKVSNLNAMRGLAKKLDEAGKGRDIYIDLDEANNG